MEKNWRITHGMSRTKIYKLWIGMIARCNNPNFKYYKDYGGRNIKVCKEWLKFENFYKDMGDKPENKSLDRINNNLGYFKKNCKWATHQEQMDNRRDNCKIHFKGGVYSVSQIAKMTKLKANVLWNRLYKLNWSLEKATTTIVKK